MRSRAEPKAAATPAQRSIRRHMVAGLAAIFVLAGGIGGWAATTQLSGAVITSGELVVESDVKKVQHPTGGVIAALSVRDGDTVKAGDIVARLDDTVTRANLAIVTHSLDEVEVRQARLEAERDGAAAIILPDSIRARAENPEVARLMHGETNLFEFRRSAREGQKSQLAERSAQLAEEGKGLASQIEAKAREIELIQGELVGVHDLYAKKLVPVQRVNELEREAARLEGERGQLVAATAQTKGKISEIALQVIQVDQDLRSEVAADLRDMQAKAAELAERKVAAEDQLKRIDIRAPQSGRVHQLAVHTVGGVVGAGEVLMLIVPVADALRIEVKVAPQDIDQIRVGQPAALRFTAFNQRTTPEVEGIVSRISADLTLDQRTGLSYYTARITLDAAELARLKDFTLTPGMPVEAFIKTGERTLLSYLIKPLSDQALRAFRAE